MGAKTQFLKIIEAKFSFGINFGGQSTNYPFYFTDAGFAINWGLNRRTLPTEHQKQQYSPLVLYHAYFSRAVPHRMPSLRPLSCSFTIFASTSVNPNFFISFIYANVYRLESSFTPLFLPLLTVVFICFKFDRSLPDLFLLYIAVFVQKKTSEFSISQFFFRVLWKRLLFFFLVVSYLMLYFFP